MEWVFVLMVTLSQGSVTTTRMTEAQCRAAVDVYEQQADPVMAYCFGPKGQRYHTTSVPSRMARLLPKGTPPVKTKPAAGQEM